MALPLSPGALLAQRYRLEEKVGAGGMGEVWRATDEQLERTVAVKVMHPGLLEDPGFAARFRAEARMMAAVSHPGVVSVHDYQDGPDGALLVMDFVAGEPLSRLLARSGRLPAATTMEMVAQAAEALAAAHARGVVHRDVKPANLLVQPDGRVVLTDFGIARAQAGAQLTATGAVLGTPSYLAPEQVLGEPANPRSDVYALGAVAYECLTGRRPFERDNPFATAMARIQEAPPTLTGDIPPAVAAVVERALAPDPARRWPTAAEFGAACRQASIAPYQPAPIPGPGPYGAGPMPARRPSRRVLALAIAGGTAGLAVLLAGAVIAIAVLVPQLTGTGDETGGRGGPVPAPDAPVAAGCEPFADYQGHEGSTVMILAQEDPARDDTQGTSWQAFGECTGITIDYLTTSDLEPQLSVRIASGTPPDLAFLQRPGLLSELAQRGALVPAPEAADQAGQWVPALRDASSEDGVRYGIPLQVFPLSLVWYSPRLFAENGYEPPATWDELLALSEDIAGDGITPWCVGAESGAATGWPLVHWLGEVMLRTHGPEVYQQWLRHEIPFDDSRAVAALDRTGEILQDPDFVNGGHGDVASIATTYFGDAGLPILDDDCALHRQGAFYAELWPPGTEIAPDGDLWIFVLPPVDPAAGRPMLGTTELAVAFDDRPEVQAVHSYLASAEWANERAAAGDFAPAQLAADPAAADPLHRLVLEALQEPGADVHYSPLELVPAELTATFWEEMTHWVTGQDSQTTLSNIDAAWL